MTECEYYSPRSWLSKMTTKGYKMRMTTKEGKVEIKPNPCDQHGIIGQIMCYCKRTRRPANRKKRSLERYLFNY